MSDPAMHASKPPAVAEPQNKLMTQQEAPLQEVADNMHEQQLREQKTIPYAKSPTQIATSLHDPNDAEPIATEKNTMTQYFERARKDAPSRFWSTYERVAKQYDDELIKRHNSNLDVLLIFAGLFLAMSSAFIVNMQSSLSPNPTDTTNSILMILINTINGSMFPAEGATLPIWAGPSSTNIWIQTLAYTSLSSSLLAAFGAVLGKQWLGHFKTSRFGRGALHERCMRRQKKLDALEEWHFSAIIAALPIFLQMSLLFFGIALAENIWTLQHTVASVIMATTAFGFIFYSFTVVSSVKSLDCPFQTPVSTALQHVVRATAPLRTSVRTKWAGILARLRKVSKNAFLSAKGLITEVAAYLSPILSIWTQVCLSTTDTEAAMGLEQLGVTGEQTSSSNMFDFSFLASQAELLPVDAVPSQAVQWALETSTDTDIIASAAGMVPEIEWPPEVDVPGVLMDRLKSGFYACFDAKRQIIPLAQAGAVACLKAMCQLCIERGLDNTFIIHADGDIAFKGDYGMYWHMVPDDPAFLVVRRAMKPGKLDIKSLPFSERMWMAHMFMYRPCKGEDGREFDAFVIDFIGVCLDSKPPPRLAADCLLLAGILLGLPINRGHLARLDKSNAITRIRDRVMNRTLALLVDEIPGPRWYQNALKLVHPLLQEFATDTPYFWDRRTSDRALKLCFNLLADDSGTLDEVRSNSVTILIRLIADEMFLYASEPPTPAQFDLLVDYHLRICEGTNYRAIRDTFKVLAWLGGLPKTLYRMRRYIDTITHFMGQEVTGDAALLAACAASSAVASMGRVDESFRERFSTVLTSVVPLPVVTQTLPNDHPLIHVILYVCAPYLRLLCALSQEPTWHSQLQQNGHFNNCFTISKALSLQRHDRSQVHHYAVPVAHIFATIDASGKEHLFFPEVQRDSIWPLILQAWHFLFDFDFFGGPGPDPPCEISTTECLAALPSLVEYAKKRWNHREAARLTELVEKVCRKLEEEKPQRERDGSQHIQDDPFWKEVLPALRKQTRKSLAFAFY